MTVGSFFAGVGGIDLGFERAGHTIVYANEIDSHPVGTYNLNFKKPADNKDICEVKGADIPDFDIMCGGFPCQAFSVAGYRQGFDDEKGRGTLFFELVRIIKEKAVKGSQPKIVFLENVKNLQGHDNGNTYRVIKSELVELGYKVSEKVLNACEYGNVPQNRERIYIVGFLDKMYAEKFSFDNIKPKELSVKLSDIIDQHTKMPDNLYYTEKCPFYSVLKQYVVKKDTLYQWRRVYVRENKSNLCPTLTANMGTGGHNVPLVLTDYGIRKLTPRECFMIQGFPNDFKLPDNQAVSRLYKQAGNSVVVPVIERIAKEITKAIK